jgi:hypothetical protein
MGSPALTLCRICRLFGSWAQRLLYVKIPLRLQDTSPQPVAARVCCTRAALVRQCDGGGVQRVWMSATSRFQRWEVLYCSS